MKNFLYSAASLSDRLCGRTTICTKKRLQKVPNEFFALHVVGQVDCRSESGAHYATVQMGCDGLICVSLSHSAANPSGLQKTLLSRP